MLEKLSVDSSAQVLQLEWTDGSVNNLSAKILRAQARDAASVRQRYDNKEIYIQPDLAITAMEQVGTTGVNIHFSDGHARAIFPFPYLRELSEQFDK